MTRLERATRDTFRSLKIRNFRLFFGGQLISQIGNWLTLVAQTLLILKLTGDGFALGLLAAAQFGPVLVFGSWAGLVADRSDKRKLLLIVQTVAMIQSFVLAALAFTGSPPVLAIYGVAMVGGLTMAFDNPTRRAFVTEMVPEEDITNAVSLNSTIMTGSRIFGPALAGLLVTVWGFGWAFLLDGISYLAVLAALWMMRTSELNPSPVTPRAKGQVREGLRYVRSVPDLWLPMVMMGIIGMLAFNFQTTFPLFATRDLGGSDITFTLIMSVLSVGSLIGAIASAQRRSISVRSVGIAALGFGVAMIFLALSPGLAVAFPVGLLVGFTSITFMTASTAIVQIKADPMMRGRVLALQSILFLGSTPIGGPIVGAVAEHWGARWSIAFGGVATVLAGGWGVFAARRQTSTPLSRAAIAGAGAEALADLDHDLEVPTGEQVPVGSRAPGSSYRSAGRVENGATA